MDMKYIHFGHLWTKIFMLLNSMKERKTPRAGNVKVDVRLNSFCAFGEGSLSFGYHDTRGVWLQTSVANSHMRWEVTGTFRDGGKEDKC